MSTGALESYLAGIDPVGAPTVLALDHAIRAAEPHLDVAIKYRILTYALRGDWRTWVCAVQVTKNGVCLRFLYGVLLDDPRGVLRAGTSVLKTWDMAFDDVVARRGRRCLRLGGRGALRPVQGLHPGGARREQGGSQGEASAQGPQLTDPGVLTDAAVARGEPGRRRHGRGQPASSSSRRS